MNRWTTSTLWIARLRGGTRGGPGGAGIGTSSSASIRMAPSPIMSSELVVEDRVGEEGGGWSLVPETHFFSGQ